MEERRLVIDREDRESEETVLERLKDALGSRREAIDVGKEAYAGP